MYKALYLSPMIPSFDLNVTGKFFKEVMGFVPAMESNTYCIYHKNQLTVHLLKAGEEIGQMEFYLEVDDLEAVWNTIKDKLEGLKVRPPFNQEYGMREIHLEIPSTNCLMFIGQLILNTNSN